MMVLQQIDQRLKNHSQNPFWYIEKITASKVRERAAIYKMDRPFLSMRITSPKYIFHQATEAPGTI